MNRLTPEQRLQIVEIYFRSAVGVRITVNDARYRAMINEFLLPKIEDIGVADLWFQQDGATCHTAGETIDLLKENIHEQIISRNGSVNWPPRSCKLTLRWITLCGAM